MIFSPFQKKQEPILHSMGSFFTKRELLLLSFNVQNASGEIVKISTWFLTCQLLNGDLTPDTSFAVKDHRLIIWNLPGTGDHLIQGNQVSAYVKLSMLYRLPDIYQRKTFTRAYPLLQLSVSDLFQPLKFLILER